MFLTPGTANASAFFRSGKKRLFFRIMSRSVDAKLSPSVVRGWLSATFCGSRNEFGKM